MIRRVVIDTKVLVSALIFTEGRVGWMRRAWQHRRLTPVVCSQTIAELVRVLKYPKFKLTDAEQTDLLADVLPYSEVVGVEEPWPSLPECRDPADRIFLALAVTCGADALISGDDDLLSLGTESPVPIMTPAQLAEARPDARPPA